MRKQIWESSNIWGKFGKAPIFEANLGKFQYFWGNLSEQLLASDSEFFPGVSCFVAGAADTFLR